MEPTAMFGSILSNAMEVHSFELGIQIALITLFIKTYTTENIAGSFLTVFVLVVFTVSPLQEITTKPWYFFSGFLLSVGVIEYREYVQFLLVGFTKLLPNPRMKRF